MARYGRFRWWRLPLYLVLGLAVLLSLLFVALRTSFAREQLRAQVNGVLSELFQGRLIIDRIGAVGLWGVSGVDARVLDPRGAQVIRAQELSARLSLPSLGYQLIANSERPELDIASVRVEHADVTLREDEELGVTLAGAFLPRDTSAPVTESAPDAGPRLRIGRISIASI
jgi:hypothetical protein